MLVFNIIASVVLMVVVLGCATTAGRLVTNNGELLADSYYEGEEAGAKDAFKAAFTWIGELKRKEWTIALVLAIVVGITSFLTATFARVATPLMPVLLAVMVSAYVGMIGWWKEYGGASGKLREVVPFLILALLFFWVSAGTASATASLLESSPFWASLVRTVPMLLWVGVSGYIVLDALIYKYLIVDEGVKKTVDLVLTVIFGFAFATSLIGTMATSVAWGQWTAPDAPGVKEAYASELEDGGSATKAETKRSYGFCNTLLQKDGDKTNNFDFGPNPFKVWLHKIGNDTDEFNRVFTATSPDLTKYRATGDATVDVLIKEFRWRIEHDPKFAAATFAWFDANLGTRFLGVFYEECQHDWATTINEAAKQFEKDQYKEGTSYYKTVDAFYAFWIDSADSISIRDCQEVDDMMYMNPFTVDGEPDVIVLKTDGHDGHEIVFSYYIKGEKTPHEVAYRIECGFQPTNVAEIMDITPQETPEPLGSGGSPTPEPEPGPGNDPTPNPGTNPDPTPNPGPGTDPDPTPTPEPGNDPDPTPTPEPGNDPDPTPEPEPGDDPEPTPEPEPEYDKDPTKGSDAKPGEADENTNNPENPDHSAAEEENNSTEYDSYQDYRADMGDLEDINENQKTGDDDNTPSTPAPEPIVNDDGTTTETTVDNNGDTGNGGEPINTPTEITDSGKATEDGKADSGENHQVKPPDD